MTRLLSCSIFLLAVGACASNSASWLGGDSVPANSAIPENSLPNVVSAVEAAAEKETTVATAIDEIAPAATVDPDLLGVLDSGQAESGKRLVTAEYLKKVFDPARTRGSRAPTTFDFDDSLVTFEFNSANLTADSIAQIEEIGKFFEHPRTEGRTFELIGHTDSVGDPAYNLVLSKKRAETIKAFIMERYPNIYPKISTDGVGEADPKDPSAERSRINRRVVLKEVK